MAEYVQPLRSVVGGEELLQIPSVSVALRDENGRLLLARHAGGDVWPLPHGAVEPAEVPADAAVREMYEETGLLVRLSAKFRGGSRGWYAPERWVPQHPSRPPRDHHQ